MKTALSGSKIQHSLKAACLAAGLLLPIVATHAATMIVTTTTDGFNPADGCSLREAIVNAETDSKAGSSECLRGSGADTIILPPQVILIQGSSSDESDPAMGDIDISTNITILGSGQQGSRLQGPAAYAGRIFDVLPGGNLTLQSVRLENGGTDQDGGAVRVATGAVFTGNDVGIVSSTAIGNGGGIYAATGAIVTIDRGSIYLNNASGIPNGSGGGIYCDGCSLVVRATTFANNVAVADGGGLYIGPGSTAALEFVTAGFDSAGNQGSGIYSAANSLSLFGALLADNGGGMPGDDLYCSAPGPLTTASYSFVEYGDCGSTVDAAVWTRADISPRAEPDILQTLKNQRFDGQPGMVLQPRQDFPEVPGASCSGHRDEFGRVAYAAASGTDYGCDVGAYEHPIMASNPMSSRVQSAGDPAVLNIGVLDTIDPLGPGVDVQFAVVGTGGVGEACDFLPVTKTITAATNGQILLIDPDTLFAAPALGRQYRVCEIEGTIVGGEMKFRGMSTGVIRLVYQDTITSSASGVSSPAPGTYLQFTGATVFDDDVHTNMADIYFRPVASNWNITGYSITGADAAQFDVKALFVDPAPSGTNFALRTTDVAGRSFRVHCKGHALGDYDAVLQLTTDNPSYPYLLYGLRCRVTHQISLGVLPNSSVSEGGSSNPVFRISLDAPSELAVPYVVSLNDLSQSPLPPAGATATLGADYVGFATTTVTINPGEQTVDVPLTVIDDDTFLEGTEAVMAALEIPVNDDVVLSGLQQQTVFIADNDVPSEGITAVLSGIPGRVGPGASLTGNVVVENTSDVAPMLGLAVSATVDSPVRVLAFGVTEVLVTCDAHNAFLVLNYPDPLLRAVEEAKFPCADGDMLSSDHSHNANDKAYPSATYIADTVSSCYVNSSEQSAVCSFNGRVPPHTKINLQAILEMARMDEAPKVDYPGKVSVQAQATAERGQVTVNAEQSYVIIGKPSSAVGGLGLPVLWVACLLALRGRRKRSVGREAR